MKNTPHRTWIAVCDASRARIFSHVQGASGWDEVRKLEHPASRAKDTDLVTGDRGRSRQSFGQGSRPAMEPTTTPKENEHEVFARQLAGSLEHDLDAGNFDDLLLVAPPHFLGLLRKAVSDHLSARVVDSIDKDYTALGVKELEQHLDEMLPSSSH